MPNANLFGRLARRSAGFLLACGVIFAGFELVICAIISTLNVDALAAELLASLPPMVQAVLGSQLGSVLSANGLLAFGWNHPIVLALGGAAATLFGTRAIAGEIESGAIELLLAQPISRASFMATQIVFALATLALLTLAGLAGSLVGRSVFHLPPLGGPGAFALALNYWLLQATVFGVTLLLSAFGQEAGRVAGAAFVLGLVSYLIEVIGQLWSKAAFLLPWSLYDRYSPRTLLQTGQLPSASLAVLGGTLVVTAALACWRFARRDLP